MSDPRQTQVTVWLDLPAEMQQWLSEVRLGDIVRGQGYTLPDGIEFGDGPLPALPDGTVEMGWGPRLTGKDIRDVAIAAAIVITSLSMYASDREHAPIVVYSQVQQDIGPDGQPRTIRTEPVLLEPGPQLEIHLEALLERLGVCIKFDFKR